MSPDTDRGRRVRAARIRKGYDRQVELARAIGYSQQMISKAETGYNFSIEFAAALMHALDMTFEYMIGEETMNRIRGKGDPNAEPC